MESKLESLNRAFERELNKSQEQNTTLRREAAWKDVNNQSLENKIKFYEKMNMELKEYWDNDLKRFGAEIEELQ